MKTKSKLIAFHGDPKIKEKYLERVREHRRLDHLVQGIGWEKNGKTRGCAVGCTLERYDHKSYETELGIPETLARLEDCIFEGLPVEKAMDWPEKFLKAVPVGADLSMVAVKFLISINTLNLAKLKNEEYGVKNAIEQVIVVLSDWLQTGRPNAIRAAESAAWAAESAAWAESAAYEWMADELLRLIKETPEVLK